MLAWARRSGESSEAYEAFTAYLLMGAKRTHYDAAASVGKGRSLMHAWSSQHDWTERCAAYDSYCLNVEIKAADKIRSKHGTNWEKRRLEMLEQNLDLSNQLRKRVQEMLDFPLVQVTTSTEDGRTLIYKPNRWNVSHIAAMAKVAAELAAQTIDAATCPDDDFDPETASPEECREFLRKYGRRSGLSAMGEEPSMPALPAPEEEAAPLGSPENPIEAPNES
jgi:hypothetical protein